MLRDLGAFIKNQPVRFFALVCVAVTSAFVMYMRYAELQVLASPDWCNRILKADQIAPASRMDAALACVGLQRVQLEAYATNSFIDGGTIALCLLALMVIVVAGGHLNFTAPGGIGASMGQGGEPAVPVKVVNPPSDPVPTTEALPPMEPKP
jgi:hypothetical protein